TNQEPQRGSTFQPRASEASPWVSRLGRVREPCKGSTNLTLVPTQERGNEGCLGERVANEDVALMDSHFSGKACEAKRTAFLARVAAAVRAGNHHREAEHVEAIAPIGLESADTEGLLERLADELKKAGAVPYPVDGPEKAHELLHSLVRRFGI